MNDFAQEMIDEATPDENFLQALQDFWKMVEQRALHSLSEYYIVWWNVEEQIWEPCVDEDDMTIFSTDDINAAHREMQDAKVREPNYFFKVVDSKFKEAILIIQ